MQANPDNFQTIATGQRSDTEFDSFTLNNVNIPCENEVKLLGVKIDFKLYFNSHISNIFKKGILTAKLPKAYKEMLNSPGKLKIYNSFIPIVLLSDVSLVQPIPAE